MRVQADTIFNQSGGSINAVLGVQTGELTGGNLGSAYNMSGGTASFVTVNLNSTALNFSGGTFTITDLGANNISRMTIDGTATVVINSAAAIAHTRFTTTGNNWLPTATGASLTVQGWSYSDFESVFTSGRIQYDGLTINAATFADTFQVNGSTLSMIPEPSTYALLFGIAAIGIAACRRRKAKN
ncbi:MAG: PEP-CTERM sorting domain-containing protein [Verrucomicrobia bacterium]|nr:PEP-CTERM sorting domain-containing protein [Verrucomicrobiota bacterium]